MSDKLKKDGRPAVDLSVHTLLSLYYNSITIVSKLLSFTSAFLQYP